MKKTAIFMASAMMLFALGSCGVTEKDLVGKWELKELADESIKAGGIELKDGGKGSIYMDTTQILHIEDKALIIGDGESAVKFDEDLINYDGTNFSVDIQGQNVITLERTDGNANEDSYDGEYDFKGGVAYDLIQEQSKSGDMVLHMTIDGDKSTVTFVDVFDYSLEKGKMKLSGYTSFLGQSDSDEAVNVEFELKGDNLTLINSDDKKDELVRVK